MADLTEHMRALSDEVGRTTKSDTIDRVQMRMRTIFDTFYDDELNMGEPSQVISDVITDLMHVAAERGVDFEAAIQDAARLWVAEREEWNLDEQ